MAWDLLSSMSGTLFGVGFPRKTTATTAAELATAAANREKQEQAAAAQMQEAAAAKKLARGTAPGVLPSAKEAKGYSSNPDAVRKRKARAPEQKKRAQQKAQLKESRDAAKAVAREARLKKIMLPVGHRQTAKRFQLWCTLEAGRIVEVEAREAKRQTNLTETAISFFFAKWVKSVSRGFAMHMSVLPVLDAAPPTPVNPNLDPPGYSTLDSSEDDEIWELSDAVPDLVDAVSSD